MGTHLQLFEYLAEFFLEWEMFQAVFSEKIKTQILCLITFFLKSCRLWDNLEKYGRAGQATDDKITRHMHFGYWITNAADTQT